MAGNWRVLPAVGVVLLAILGGVNYFFSPVPSTSTGVQQRSVLSTSPDDSVYAVYHNIAFNRIDDACGMFDSAGRQAFADDLGAADCKQAAQRAHDQATDTNAYYVKLDIPPEAIVIDGNQSTIDSCKMTVLGGPRLGVFLLSKSVNGDPATKDGWIITGHRKDNPMDCAG